MLASVMGLFGKSSDSSDSKLIEGQAISSYVDVSTFTMKRHDGPETWRIYKMMSEFSRTSPFYEKGFTHAVIAGPAQNLPESTPYYVMLGIKNRRIVKVSNQPQPLF